MKASYFSIIIIDNMKFRISISQTVIIGILSTVYMIPSPIDPEPYV